jgi:hypothetical protein
LVSVGSPKPLAGAGQVSAASAKSAPAVAHSPLARAGKVDSVAIGAANSRHSGVGVTWVGLSSSGQPASAGNDRTSGHSHERRKRMKASGSRGARACL